MYKTLELISTDFHPDVIYISVHAKKKARGGNKVYGQAMSRIYPAKDGSNEGSEVVHPCPSKFTVWKRSSMTFQGTDGFTVFDQQGRLAFRVDNYSRTRPRASQGGLVLMDGSGKALITMRPQILSVHRRWNAYVGDGGGDMLNRIFSMRRSLRIRGNVTEEVELTMAVGSMDVRVEGSFRGRNCVIRDSTTGEELARIARKRVNATVLLDNDVISMVVQPAIGSEIVMAFVVIMDRICCRALPALCS